MAFDFDIFQLSPGHDTTKEDRKRLETNVMAGDSGGPNSREEKLRAAKEKVRSGQNFLHEASHFSLSLWLNKKKVVSNFS